MSATTVYTAGDTPSALPTIPGPGQTVTTLGPPPQYSGVLPETGFDVGTLVGVAALLFVLSLLCALNRAGNR